MTDTVVLLRVFMEQFILELAKQVPSLAVLAGIVIMFLKHLHALEASRSSETTARDEILVKLNDNCHAFQHSIAERTEQKWAKVATALDKNTEALGKNSATMHSVDERIAKIDSHMRRSGVIQPQSQSHPNPGPA